MAGMLLVFLFRFERESVQDGVFSLYSFLGEETRKAIARLKLNASDRAENREENRKDSKPSR